jgi:hypothetical protein
VQPQVEGHVSKHKRPQANSSPCEHLSSRLETATHARVLTLVQQQQQPSRAAAKAAEEAEMLSCAQKHHGRMKTEDNGRWLQRCLSRRGGTAICSGQKSGGACSAAAAATTFPWPASSAHSSHLQSAPRAGGA